MTQTHKTTSGPKESKAKHYLVNILTLESDPIVLTLETRPESSLVGRALSLTGETQVEDGLRRWSSWLRPTIASMLPGPCGCLGPGIRKRAERIKKEGGGRVQMHGYQG
jgi:hypothetical protein